MSEKIHAPATLKSGPHPYNGIWNLTMGYRSQYSVICISLSFYSHWIKVVILLQVPKVNHKKLLPKIMKKMAAVIPLSVKQCSSRCFLLISITQCPSLLGKSQIFRGYLEHSKPGFPKPLQHGFSSPNGYVSPFFKCVQCNSQPQGIKISLALPIIKTKGDANNFINPIITNKYKN